VYADIITYLNSYLLDIHKSFQFIRCYITPRMGIALLNNWIIIEQIICILKSLLQPLTLWNRVLLGKKMVAQIVKKFPYYCLHESIFVKFYLYFCLCITFLALMCYEDLLQYIGKFAYRLLCSKISKFRLVQKKYSVSNLLSIYLSMALQPFFGPWPLFQFLNPIHSRQDSLNGVSARRKAATYTQNNTNTG
jgi:hypothetical protein